MAATQQIDAVPTLRAGQWESGNSDSWGDVYNPSTGQKIARVPLCSAEEAGKVVEAAADALPGWSNTPAIERARILFRFRGLMEQHFEQPVIRFAVPTNATTATSCS